MAEAHDIRTYYDGYKLRVSYCAKCGEESPHLLYSEPCSGKIVDKVVDNKDTKA